ncbi:hypothetical protein R6Q59_000515 [Mikania micrantha]
MTIKRMLFNYISVSRYSTSFLKTGDKLKQTRIFSSQDLVNYSSLELYTPHTLHFRMPVYVEEEIIGEVEATSIKGSKNKYIAKFVTRCCNNKGVLVLDGEAMAILPTLCLTQV